MVIKAQDNLHILRITEMVIWRQPMTPALPDNTHLVET